MLSLEGAYRSIFEKTLIACIAGSIPSPDALLMLLSRHCDGLGVGRQARVELTDVELSSIAAEVSLTQLAQSRVKFTCKCEQICEKTQN